MGSGYAYELLVGSSEQRREPREASAGRLRRVAAGEANATKGTVAYTPGALSYLKKSKHLFPREKKPTGWRQSDSWRTERSRRRGTAAESHTCASNFEKIRNDLCRMSHDLGPTKTKRFVRMGSHQSERWFKKVARGQVRARDRLALVERRRGLPTAQVTDGLRDRPKGPHPHAHLRPRRKHDGIRILRPSPRLSATRRIQRLCKR